MKPRINIDFDNSVLAEKVANILKDSITSGKIKSGEQLIEVDYQKLFNISRTPLREAFRSLEKLGIVEIIPRKGTFVKTLSKEEIEDVFTIRANLEGLAARLAYSNRNPDFLSKIELITKKMETALNEHDKMTYWKEHNAFHNLYIDCSGNLKLKEILEGLHTQYALSYLSYHYFHQDVDIMRSFKAHSTLLELFMDSSSSPDKIEKITKKHLDDAKKSFLSFLHHS